MQLKRQLVKSMSVFRGKQPERLADGRLSKQSLSARHEQQQGLKSKPASASEKLRNRPPKRLLL